MVSKKKKTAAQNRKLNAKEAAILPPGLGLDGMEDTEKEAEAGGENLDAATDDAAMEVGEGVGAAVKAAEPPKPKRVGLIAKNPSMAAWKTCSSAGCKKAATDAAKKLNMMELDVVRPCGDDSALVTAMTEDVTIHASGLEEAIVVRLGLHGAKYGVLVSDVGTFNSIIIELGACIALRDATEDLCSYPDAKTVMFVEGSCAAYGKGKHDKAAIATNISVEALADELDALAKTEYGALKVFRVKRKVTPSGATDVTIDVVINGGVIGACLRRLGGAGLQDAQDGFH